MKTVAVFAYDFPHRKTSDFIMEMVACGFRDMVVLAAGKKRLTHQDTNDYFQTSLLHCPPMPVSELCTQLNLRFYSVEHNDFDRIAELQKMHSIDFGIISGARIIQPNIIDLFKDGIINFHPGKIPETSGLDSFFYTVKNNVPAGVTTHFIDYRVDAGKIICFDEAFTSGTCTPETVLENTYQLQRFALRRVLSMIKGEAIHSESIYRPFKNTPMTPEEKIMVLSHFPQWRASRLISQERSKFFKAIEDNDISVVREIINNFPNFALEANSRGWTPLITAAFHNDGPILNLLLQKGANPNDCGMNGTTALMYAKTKSLNNKNATYDFLDFLIANGADCSRTDCYGKTILDYVTESGDERMLDFFRKKLKVSNGIL